jgi:hypothetical protein
MLFREIIAVYCENHMKHTNTLRGQNAEFYYVKAGGIHVYSNHSVLKELEMFYTNRIFIAVNVYGIEFCHFTHSLRGKYKRYN